MDGKYKYRARFYFVYKFLAVKQIEFFRNVTKSLDISKNIHNKCGQCIYFICYLKFNVIQTSEINSRTFIGFFFWRERLTDIDF